jgi:hypothetical protein
MEDPVIDIPRSLARRFRAVLRRSLQDTEQRNAWPLLLCRADERGLTLEAVCSDFALRYQQPGARPPETLVFRTSVLAEVEGRTDAPAHLERVDPKSGRTRFEEAGEPRCVEFDLVTADSAPPFPPLPKKLAAVPAAFLTALTEAARTCGPASSRLALSRVQLRGQKGEVIGTDGRQLLIQRGFPMPWKEDVLVPRLTALGGREVEADGEVGVGRTDKHVVVRTGPWTFALTIDAGSRYPDVAVAVPRATSTTTRLHLDEADAAYLIDTLPKLPGGEEDHSPVTLDLDGGAAVRARGEDGAPAEAALRHSTPSGPRVRLCINRRLLRRALLLGLRDVQVISADKPVAFPSDRLMYVVMTLDKGGAIPPGRKVLQLAQNPAPKQAPAPPPLEEPAIERREETMPAPTPAGPPNGGNGSQQPPRYGIDELIDDAEQLRASLHDASVRVSRLLAALKLQRRQSRALRSAVASLQQLQLGP